MNIVIELTSMFYAACAQRRLSAPLATLKGLIASRYFNKNTKVDYFKNTDSIEQFMKGFLLIPDNNIVGYIS
jgi:hypothetical protein